MNIREFATKYFPVWEKNRNVADSQRLRSLQNLVYILLQTCDPNINLDLDINENP